MDADARGRLEPADLLYPGARRAVPQDIERHVFDLIVIGAGINGAGIARDAAMWGLRVLLLDRGDISSGASQWATRLIHGGLHYLEHYEFGLVREFLRDTERAEREVHEYHEWIQRYTPEPLREPARA